MSEGNLHKLKGRILFRQHVSRNLLHKERIYTAHQVYDRDNRFNQILKRALDIVATRRLLWGTRGIRPDIEATLELGGIQKRVILDTKWKLPVNGIPSDDDLRQMFAYNVHFGGRRGVLLYPLASHDQARVGHNFAPSRAVAPGFAHDCSTFYVDMFDANQRLRKDIGAQIIQQAVIHG